MACVSCSGDCEAGRTGPDKGYYMLVWLAAWEPQGCLNDNGLSCGWTLC